jgi:hypothetical protein
MYIEAYGISISSVDIRFVDEVFGRTIPMKMTINGITQVPGINTKPFIGKEATPFHIPVKYRKASVIGIISVDNAKNPIILKYTSE